MSIAKSILAIVAVIILVSCSTSTPTLTLPPKLISTPTATTIPLPALSLKPGDFYFSLDGVQSMIFARNPTGYTPEDFSLLLDWARQGGTKLLRIHLTVGWNTVTTPWSTTTGEVNEAWAQNYDRLFDDAEADGIWIMPVFCAWFNWNNGTPDIGGADWKYNPYNQANGGPFKDPGDLFLPDSPMQQAWIGWVKSLVERWQGRDNIAAWEIFSEINLATGPAGHTDSQGAVSESLAEDFTNRAAAVIRAADDKKRPLTLSLAGGAQLKGEWANFYNLSAIDFIQIHPYSASLDRELITQVQNREQYHKPIMIGESGLDAFSAINPPNAHIGIQHAIWAGVVSGAVNARAFWTNDGWAFYGFDRPQAVEYMEIDAVAELPASRFTEGVDFAGFKPLTSSSSPAVWGAAVGNESMVLGWFRDATSEPPNWTVQTIPAGQTVTLTIPGTAANWLVDFYDTSTGTKILFSTSVSRKGNTVTVTLPSFQDDIAFKMKAGAETSVITPEVIGNTNEIAGTWSGTISNAAGSFSTIVQLDIQPGCKSGTTCGKFSTPEVGCSGTLFLNEIHGDTYVFIEQNSSGGTTCVSGGYESLQLQPDGTLTFQYSSSQGGAALSSGTLTRP